MKRLFLILALAFSAPALAGNLGIADQYMSGLREIERLETLPSSFEIHVGQLAVRNKPSFWKKFRENKAVALFEDGLFKIVTDKDYVDLHIEKGLISRDIELDESGIKPEQVISFNYGVTSFWNIDTEFIMQNKYDDNDTVVTYHLLYRDSEGQVELATWNFIRANDKADAFKRTFLNWMSEKSSFSP